MTTLAQIAEMAVVSGSTHLPILKACAALGAAPGPRKLALSPLFQDADNVMGQYGLGVCLGSAVLRAGLLEGLSIYERDKMDSRQAQPWLTGAFPSHLAGDLGHLAW